VTAIPGEGVGIGSVASSMVPWVWEGGRAITVLGCGQSARACIICRRRKSIRWGVWPCLFIARRLQKAGVAPTGVSYTKETCLDYEQGKESTGKRLRGEIPFLLCSMSFSCAGKLISVGLAQWPYGNLPC
jgi:hypothetical protein